VLVGLFLKALFSDYMALSTTSLLRGSPTSP
jgi:hypothetical protein